MKKAQAAMEFLMTYGWAILVVLIAIGALAYFGVLRPEQYLPEKCTISTGSGLFCAEFTTDATNNKIQLKIHNILTEKVTITKIETDVPKCTFSGTQEIAADGKEVIDLTGCSPALVSKTTKIKVTMSITYKVSDSTLIKGTTGTLTTVVP